MSGFPKQIKAQATYNRIQSTSLLSNLWSRPYKTNSKYRSLASRTKTTANKQKRQWTLREDGIRRDYISLSPTDVNISRCDKKTNPEIVERPVILVNDATISPQNFKKTQTTKNRSILWWYEITHWANKVTKLTSVSFRDTTRRYPWGIQSLVSTHPFHHVPNQNVWGGCILSNLKLKVPSPDQIFMGGGGSFPKNRVFLAKWTKKSPSSTCSCIADSLSLCVWRLMI